MTGLSNEKARRGRPPNPKGGIDKAREMYKTLAEAGTHNIHQMVDALSEACGINKTTARLYIYRFRKTVSYGNPG